MKTYIKIVFGCIFIVFSTTIFAQEKSDGLPISIEVATQKVYTDGAVILQGNTSSLDNNPALLFVQIIKPDNKKEELKVWADKKSGNYTVKYYPKMVGKYEATAFAPDKIKSASVEFEVELNWENKEEIDAAIKEIDQTISVLATSIQTIENDPSVPESDKAPLKIKWGNAEKSLKKHISALDELKEAITKIKWLTNKYPPFAEKIRIQERAGELYSELDDQNKQLKNIRDRMTEKLKGDDVCGRLFALSEGCSFLSTMMNFKCTKVMGILKNIGIDKVWPKFYNEALVNQQGNKEANLIAIQAGKAVASSTGKLEELKTVDYNIGVFGDLTQHISDRIRNKICTEYVGDLNGEYALEFKNNGKRYLYYKYNYSGKIALMARKEKAGKEGANFSGYLEANINQVEFDDDIWAVEDKSQWQEIYYKRLKMAVVPLDLTKTELGFGIVATQALPGAFYFPLKGKIVEGKMVVELLPAMLELSSVNANRTAIIVQDPHNEFNRRGVVFSYPTTTAKFMITRSMRMPENNPKVVLPIKSENGTPIIEGNFSRTETPADTKVDFKLNFKMKTTK